MRTRDALRRCGAGRQRAAGPGSPPPRRRAGPTSSSVSSADDAAVVTVSAISCWCRCRLLPRLHRRPLLFGRIAANPAGDLTAMVPRRRPRSPSSPWHTVLMRSSRPTSCSCATGATETLTEAGAVLVGVPGKARSFWPDWSTAWRLRSALAQERHARATAGADETAGPGPCLPRTWREARRRDRCRPGDDAKIETTVAKHCAGTA